VGEKKGPNKSKKSRKTLESKQKKRRLLQTMREQKGKTDEKKREKFG